MFAAVLRERGRVGIAVNVPPATKGSGGWLKPRSLVRYSRDAVDGRNGSRPVVRIIVPYWDLSRGSASIAFGSDGLGVVLFGMKQNGSQRLCQFTRGHAHFYSPVVLDRRIVADPLVGTSSCGSTTWSISLPSHTVRGPFDAYGIWSDIQFGPWPVAWQSVRMVNHGHR